MKLEKNKHDHKLTDYLKVIIFSLLMLAPLLASVSQMLYVSLNKNAYQSYSGTQEVYKPIEYKTNEVNSNDDLIVGNYYTLYFQSRDESQYVWSDLGSTASFTSKLIGYYIGESNEYYLDEFLVPITYGNETSVLCDFYLVDDYIYLYYFCEEYSDNLFSIYMYSIYATEINPYFNLQLTNEIKNAFINNSLGNYAYTFFSQLNDNHIQEYELIETSTLDNAFYYGVDQMTKSELFNWTENTALYTGIKAMTDNLQIQTNAIAILLTYWFILTIIYIIIDIVLKMFTFITHSLSAKL